MSLECAKPILNENEKKIRKWNYQLSNIQLAIIPKKYPSCTFFLLKLPITTKQTP